MAGLARTGGLDEAMSHGPRPFCARPIRLALLLSACPLVAGQYGIAPAIAQETMPPARPDAANTDAAAAETDISAMELDPNAPLAPLPDMGVDWPDMEQADRVVALEPEPGDTPPSAPGMPVPVIEDTAATADDIAPVLQVNDNSELRYTVQMEGLDDIVDDRFEHRFNTLSVLKQGEDKAANTAQINRRLKEDDALIDRLMRAKGYYDARVRGELLPPAGDSARLRVQLEVTPGPLYLLSAVTLNGLTDAGTREATLRDAFGVAIGAPVDADVITEGRAKLTTALGENGFPFGKVDEPVVRIDHEDRSGQLTMDVITGGYRTFGAILAPNDTILGARHIQRIARFRPGDMWMASDVDDLRRALVATGLVSTVKLTPQDAGDGQTANLDVELVAAPPRTVAGELGYGTGEGFKVEASWQHRNFLPPEGGLTVRGVLGTQEQTLAAAFRRNNFQKRDRVLNAQLSVSNIKRDAYDARTIELSGNLERQTNLIFQKTWTWSLGAELVASDERDSFFTTGLPRRRTFFIAALPTSLHYDGSDDLLNPTTGFRLGARVSPEGSFQNSTFGYVRAQVEGSFYFPMGEKLVIAGRSRLGSILGSSVDRIAPSRRYFAGGGGSVRGYGYQDIGPRDVNNDPIGGRSLAEFSLEARVRFGVFGVVPFVDAGNISTGFLPNFNDLRIGAGIGARYYSSFGPIRVDVGTPLNPQKGDPKVAVYVSLGQAF